MYYIEEIKELLKELLTHYRDNIFELTGGNCNILIKARTKTKDRMVNFVRKLEKKKKKN